MTESKNILPVVKGKVKTITIQRKNKEGRVTASFDYAKVSARVAQFNQDNSNGSIRTEHRSENGWTLFKAIIIPDVKNLERYFTGTSLGKLGTEKALEKLETIAVGRALAFAGLLSDGEIASSEEMEKYEEFVSIVDEKEIMEATVTLESAQSLEELSKIWKSFSQSRRDNIELVTLKNKLKKKYEDTSSRTTDRGVATTPQGEDNGDRAKVDSGNSSGEKEV